MASTKATVVTYTEKELAAIATLQANRAVKMSYKELGIPTAILSSLVKKAADERPMADGLERVIINKEVVSGKCETCGHPFSYNLYWID